MTTGNFLRLSGIRVSIIRDTTQIINKIYLWQR